MAEILDQRIGDLIRGHKNVIRELEGLPDSQQFYRDTAIALRELLERRSVGNATERRIPVLGKVS